MPITEPVLLTQKGNTVRSSDKPVFLTVQTKPELPFSYFQFDPAALIGQRSGFVLGLWASVLCGLRGWAGLGIRKPIG